MALRPPAPALPGPLVGGGRARGEPPAEVARDEVLHVLADVGQGVRGPSGAARLHEPLSNQTLATRARAPALGRAAAAAPRELHHHHLLLGVRREGWVAPAKA
eukprot:10837732-Lingulodinium_polyedra.AAC.1